MALRLFLGISVARLLICFKISRQHYTNTPVQHISLAEGDGRYDYVGAMGGAS
jgi:hypothetical protein